MSHTAKEYDTLKRAVPIWQIVQARIPELEQQGSEYKCRCPFHEDDTPSFTLYENSDGIWVYKCFGCGANGNVVQFVKNFDKITEDQAFEKVSSFAGWKAGKENVESTFKPLKEKAAAITIPVEKIAEAERSLENSPVALRWLAGRGLTLETAKKLRVGFVQSAKAVNPHHPWVDDGWMVFPTIEGDFITSLKYRSVKGKKTEKGEPGFLRKSGMATGLFNIDSIETFDDVYIVEGEPDCMAMVQAGYTAVSLPSAGFNLTPDMRDRVMQANRIFLAGDMDNAGNVAMTKLWTELRERTYRLEWPQGMKDANQTLLENCGGNTDEFTARIEELKKKALEQPIPFMFDLRETLSNAGSNFIQPMEREDRLRMPWSNIDSWTAILPGDVVAVSATETGTGKTSWVMDILLHNAIKYGKIIANYSGEVMPTQYALRAAAHLLKKKKDSITPADFQEAADLLTDARFYNGYKPGANWRDVIDLLIWAKRRLGADIIVVDHLHFLTRGEKDETKAQSEAMRAIKDIAVDFNVIPIVLGQPRKPLANHRGRMMNTQDLKGSESFGSDASQIFILHRDRKTTGDDENMPIFDPVTTVKLDKSRESEPRATKLFFDGASCTFTMLQPTQSAAFAGEYDE